MTCDICGNEIPCDGFSCTAEKWAREDFTIGFVSDEIEFIPDD